MNFMKCALCKGELDIIGESENGFVKVTRCKKCGAQLKQKTSKKEKNIPTTYIRNKFDID